jgi:hypothetical protein
LFFFVAYAVAVWYAACRFRRSWRGFGAVAVGLLGCAILAWLHWRLYIWSEGRYYLRVLQVMLYPYALLVTVVGLFFASLPRHRPAYACRTCLYDMDGLLPLISECPECGARWKPAAAPTDVEQTGESLGEPVPVGALPATPA